MIKSISVQNYPNYNLFVDFESKEASHRAFTLHTSDNEYDHLYPLYMLTDLQLEKEDNNIKALSRAEILGIIAALGMNKIEDLLKITMVSNNKSSSACAFIEVIYYLKSNKYYNKYKYELVFNKEGIVNQKLFEFNNKSGSFFLIKESYDDSSLFKNHSIMYPIVYNYFYLDYIHLMQSNDLPPLLKKTNNDFKFMSKISRIVNARLDPSDSFYVKNNELMSDLLSIANIKTNLDSNPDYTKIIGIQTDVGNKKYPLAIKLANGTIHNIKDHIVGDSNYKDRLALLLLLYNYAVTNNSLTIINHPDQIFVGDDFAIFSNLMKYCINYKTDRQDPNQLLIIPADKNNLHKIIPKDEINK